MKNSSLSVLDEILPAFKGVLLDAYGVFWAGGIAGLIPGAKEAMKNMVSSGKKVGILSNTTQLSSHEIEKVRSHGLYLGEHFHFYLTSGDIARNIFCREKLPFSSRKKKFWLFGQNHPRLFPHKALFQGTPFQETKEICEADFIYVSIPHISGEDQTDVDVFLGEIDQIQKIGIPMVCANPDHFAHEGNPPKAVVRQGSIASVFKEKGGDVFYMGKPEPIAYQSALDQFSLYGTFLPEDVLMIGDTPEIDIRGAKKINMASALVTKTGIMGDRVRTLGWELAIESLKEDVPDFFIERLGV